METRFDTVEQKPKDKFKQNWCFPSSIIFKTWMVSSLIVVTSILICTFDALSPTVSFSLELGQNYPHSESKQIQDGLVFLPSHLFAQFHR